MQCLRENYTVVALTPTYQMGVGILQICIYVYLQFVDLIVIWKFVYE